MTTASKLISWLKEQLERSYEDVNCSELLVEGIRATGEGSECKNYRCGGTNELWRSAGASEKYRYITKRMTLKAAQDSGHLRPGVLLCIWEPGYNDKYDDNEGNCDHIGVYIGEMGCEVIHSSATVGKVAVSTLKNGWTHVLIHKLIDLDDVLTEDTAPDELPMVVATREGDALLIRDKPTTAGRKLGSVEDGGKVIVTGTVQVDSEGREWFPVRAKPKNRRAEITGFMCADYLVVDPAEIDDIEQMKQKAETTEADVDMVAVPRSVLLALADAANELYDGLSVLAYRNAANVLYMCARDVTRYLKGDD